LSAAISFSEATARLPRGFPCYADQIRAATRHEKNIPFHTSITNTKAQSVSSIIAKFASAIALNE
jgi:hypothetical protein